MKKRVIDPQEAADLKQRQFDRELDNRLAGAVDMGVSVKAVDPARFALLATYYMVRDIYGKPVRNGV